MRHILLLLSLFLSISSFAQSKAQVDALVGDVNTYKDATVKIQRMTDCQGGIDELTALIAKREKESDYSKPMLASFYKGRANGYLRLKRYGESAADYNTAIALLRQAGESGRANLGNAWYELSLVYYNWGKQEETWKAVNECVESTRTYYGASHSSTLEALDLRANIAAFYGKGDLALSDRVACFDIVQSNVERNFTYLTADERTAYWEKNRPHTTALLTFAHKLNERQSSVTDRLYDQQLLAKGLLLTAESALQRAVDSDPRLQQSYQAIRALRKKAADEKSTPAEAEAATLEADRMEREMGTEASSLHQFMSFLKVHSGDVKKALGKDDVAIEFVDYRVGRDSTMYAALVMSPRWRHVRFMPLAERGEIERGSDNLSAVIWQPVLQTLGYTPRNIYFAPSGLLYQIPLESHPAPQGGYMCDKFIMHRMSSTRWLAYSAPAPQGENAVVYGGLEYDMSVEAMRRDTHDYHLRTRSAAVDASLLREAPGGVVYLEGTKTEAEAIARTFRPADRATLYTGAAGTEASFKALDGKGTQVVHIGTHGFFADAQGTAADDAMARCGLLMAGAARRYQGGTVPADVEDGILTAQEIAGLDLSGLDMVTLSACDTGLGRITGDGVFGLQRGFKKAGAQSILMSLWKVDDEATCTLMTEFYRHWIGEGRGKHEALELAKQAVRSHTEKGWDNPRFWAAFILLDAIK